MVEEYCDVCKARRGFKRDLGWGTFFAVLLTFGFWLFVIPFYPKRCVVCGNRLKKGFAPKDYAILALGFLILVAIITPLLHTPSNTNSTNTPPPAQAPRKTQVIAQAQQVLKDVKQKYASHTYLIKSDYDNLSDQYLALLPYKKDNERLFNDIVRYRKIAFANVIEKTLLENGNSATVVAGNQDLIVKLPFVSKAIAYQLANRGEIYEHAKETGFKRLIFKDNLNDSYVYTLDKS